MNRDPTRAMPSQGTDDSYDWDVDDDERPGARILWGRVLALALALIVAFVIGRVTAGDDSADAETERLQERVAALQAEVDGLRAEAAADSPAPTEAPDEDEEAQEEAAGEEGTTYTVREGDTLNTIAERFYGDVALADLIIEANDIANPARIRPGDRLEIPPEP